MTVFQKEVIDRLARIETKLDADYREIHGNGKPGLIDKVGDLDTRVQTVEEQHKNEHKHGGMIAVTAAWLITTAIAVWAIIR